MELRRGTGCPVSGGLREYWTPERKRMAWMVLCATAVCSFAAHGFLFSNEFFSHDSISYFTYGEYKQNRFSKKAFTLVSIMEAVVIIATAVMLIMSL